MAYTPIPETSIQVGKSLKKELFQAIRDSLIDHESRIGALALGSAPIEIFNFDVLNASSARSLTGLAYYRAMAGFTISKVQIEIFEKGIVTSGNLEVDIKKGTSLDPTTFSSVLTTLPNINFSLYPDYSTVSGVLDTQKQDVLAGEVLRLDITNLPAIPLGKFRVLVYGQI